MEIPGNRHLKFFILLLLGFWSVSSWAQENTAADDDVAPLLRARLERQAAPGFGQTAFHDSGALKKLYRERAYRPLWVGNGGLRYRGRIALEAVENAALRGLEPQDYHLSGIRRLLNSVKSWPEPRQAMELELLLSDGLLTLAQHVSGGRVSPRQVDPEWLINPPGPDKGMLSGMLLNGQELNKALDALEPPHWAYARLKSALEHYQRLQAAGGWSMLPPGPLLKEGDRGEQVPLLRRRLHMEGYENVEAVVESERFGVRLAAAVRSFQARHGLYPDGIVGPRTRKALNVSAGQRVRQITSNLERWRWLPRDMGDRYLLVNTAGFRLELMEAGHPILEMKVIVGKRYRRTPAFTKAMTYLEVNPTWNIPPRIVKEDIVPKLNTDPGYLDRMGIRVFDGWKTDSPEISVDRVDWRRVGVRYSPYKLQQASGPKNALGRIKFMLPNRHSIYLHDTPRRDLFNETVRSFSSGCIRLEKPLELARLILGDDPRWGDGRLRDIIDSGRTRQILLRRPLPVYLVYFTAWVDENNEVQFREDIYNRDGALETALFGE